VGDFLRVILDSIQFLWPFRLVRQWERGGYYVAGRWWKEVGPGCYPVVPWFTEVREISTVPAIVSTPKQDITLTDGSTLHFSVSASVRVFDLNLAVNTVDSYHQTTQELVAAVLADKLARVKAERLAPETRGALLASLRNAVAAEASLFGVEVTKIWFTNFVLKAKTFRLLQDTPVSPW
jgi:hypothetical protein